MKTFRSKFLELALATEVITINKEGRVFFDPLFKGNAYLACLAACSCRELMSMAPGALHHAEIFMAFDAPSYPLLPLVAQEFQGGDAKEFLNFSLHSRYPRGFLKGKKVVLLSTRENEVEFHGAIAYVQKFGGEVLGSVVLFSEAFGRKQNENIALPIERVLLDEDVLIATLTEQSTGK